MVNNTSHYRIKLPHQVIVKAPGLLPMYYTVRELARELDMPERTLRDWLARGAPHSRDNRQHIWIDGQEFAGWVEKQRLKKKRVKLADDEAYCLRCNFGVKLVDPKTIPIRGKLIHIRGICPNCGCVIQRGGRRGKSD